MTREFATLVFLHPTGTRRLAAHGAAILEIMRDTAA
jgi:hypothetical protein